MVRKITSIAPAKTKTKKVQTVKTAELSTDGMYRWDLTRSWAGSDPVKCQMWVMLNPSTADAFTDDPTIKRCMSFATREGYNGIHVVNLFAFRSTEPDELLTAANPVGELNHRYFERALAVSQGPVVAAWGDWYDSHRQRASYFPRPDIETIVQSFGRSMVCFGTNASGSPKHPLYLNSDSAIKEYYQ